MIQCGARLPYIGTSGEEFEALLHGVGGRRALPRVLLFFATMKILRVALSVVHSHCVSPMPGIRSYGRVAREEIKA